MKLNKKINILEIYIIALFVIFVFRFLDIRIYNMISKYGPMLSFFTSIFLLFIFRKRLLEKNFNLLFILWFVLVVVLMGGLKNSFGFGGLIVIFSVSTLFIIIPNLNLSNKLIEKITGCMFIFLIIYSISDKSGYNLNTIGQVTYVLFVYSLIYLENKKMKFITIPFSIFLSYTLIEKSESRGAMLGFIAFLVIVYLIPKKVLSSKFIFYSFITILTLGAIIFCIVYVDMWINGVNLKVGNSTKSLYSGREIIWLELLNLIKLNPIFGVGSKYILTSFNIFNSHNSMLNILSVYGIPVFCCIIYLIFYTLSGLRIVLKDSKKIKICLAGIWGYFLLAFFETNLLWEPICFQGIFILGIAYSYKKILANMEEKNDNSFYTNL